MEVADFLTKPYTCRSAIRFSHCDPAGYVFFARFFDMLQATTEDWLTQRLGINFAEMIMERHLGNPTAHTECQFIKPCVLGEYLDISLILEKIGNTSFTVRYIGYVAGEVRLRARSVQIMIETRTGRPVPFESEFLARLEEYKEQVIAPDDTGPEKRG